MPTLSFARFPAFLAALSLLASLAGCASVSVADDPLKLPAGTIQSAVVVSITANTGETRGFSDMQVRLLPPPGSEGGIDKYYVLKRMAPGMARDTSLFVGALPPGQYEFASLGDSATNKILRLHGAAALLGAFPVEAGKPADLGRLIVTPVNSKVIFGRSARVTSNMALLERFAPAHAPLFARGASGWGRARLADDQVEEYALQRPVGAECATELESGAVVAASRLGTVLQRSKEGHWGALRGPGIDSLLCVTAADMPDAELLAVGEFGNLLRKPPQEDRLVPVATGDLPAGNLLRIAGNRKAGWHVALQNGNDVTVYHTADLASGKWTARGSVDVGFDMWNGPNGFWMWGDARGMGYTGSKGPLHLLDYASGAWSERDTPGRDRLTALSVDPAGGIGVLTSPGGGFGGVFAGVWISNDAARTWQPVEAPFKVKISPVQRAWDGSMYMAGGVFGTAELQVSKDGGKTWALATKYELGRQLLPLRSGELIDFNAGQWGIFSIEHSRDGGKTWRIEYSNFDRRAYEASKK